MKQNGNGPMIPKSIKIPGRDEFEYVHDLLSTIANDVQLIRALDVEGDDLTVLLASRNVLCWLLGHTNTSFPDGVRELEDSMRELGLDMRKNH